MADAGCVGRAGFTDRGRFRMTLDPYVRPKDGIGGAMIVAEGSGIGDRSSSDSPVSALRMSASGHERTWETAIWTSAFGGKPDVDLASANVASSQKRSLETCKRRPVTQGDAV